MVRNMEERNAALRFSVSGGKPMPPCRNGASSMKRAKGSSNERSSFFATVFLTLSSRKLAAVYVKSGGSARTS
jgi:hypothetical protein